MDVEAAENFFNQGEKFQQEGNFKERINSSKKVIAIEPSLEITYNFIENIQLKSDCFSNYKKIPKYLLGRIC
jgi:hypothetical protein